MTGIFEDVDGNDIDPYTLLNVFCKIKAAIKFEGIFMNAKNFAFQFRLYHVIVTPLNSNPVRILARPDRNSIVDICDDFNPMVTISSSHEEKDDEEEKVVDSDEEDIKPVTRRKKITKKK